MSSQRTSIDSLALVALVAGAVGIAFSPIFVRLPELPPTATAFQRVLLALPLLWGWLTVRPATPDEAAPTTPMLLLPGAFFAGDLTVWHWSINYTSMANATLLANFAPIFVTLGSFVLYGERSSRLFLVGLVTALSGAVVLMGDSLRLGGAHLLGDALGLITALFYAGYILSVSRLRARHTVATVMAWSTLGATILLLPIALISGEALIPVTLRGWAVLLGLAWLSHAGGQGLIAFALAHLPAAFSSVTLLVQPAAAALLAWLLLAEPLGPLQAAGAAVILAGIAAARRGSR